MAYKPAILVKYQVGDAVEQRRYGYMGHIKALSRDGMSAVVDFDITWRAGLSVVKLRTGGLRKL